MSQAQSPTPQKLSQSPTAKAPVVKEGQIDFPTAIKAVIDGKKITKEEWGSKEIYCFLNGNILSLHKEDGQNYQWIISDGDLNGDDWMIL